MVVWQLRGENQDCERRAVRLIGVTLFALAAYLAVESIGDLTLIADVAESAFCAFTSAAALLALGLNAWPGWWRAAPAAALVIAALAAREGLEEAREEN